MSEGKTLKEIALDLLEKYRQSEEGMIWECSGSISEDTAKLEYECNYIRMQIERMAEPKWIPVTERLPEKTGEYLCSVSNIPYHYSISGYYYANLNCWAVDDEAASNNVVAWMPLPTPWKGEE